MDLETSKDGDCTTSVINLFHCSAVLRVKTSPYLPCFKLCLLTHTFWYYGSQNCVQYPMCDLMVAEHFIRILCYFQSYVKEALSAEDAGFSPFRVLINLQLLFLGENLLLIPLNTSCFQAAAANCFFLGKYPLSKI